MNMKVCLVVLSALVASCVARYFEDPIDDFTYRRNKQTDWVPLNFRIGTNTLRCQMYVPPGVPASIGRAWSAVTKEGSNVNRAIKETSLGAKVSKMLKSFWKGE